MRLGLGLAITDRRGGAGGGGAPNPIIRIMVMGQSEMEYLFNPDSFYSQIPQPSSPGNGNVVVFTQAGAGNPPVRTVVNPTTVAADQVNPVIAAWSALFAYVRSGYTFVIGDGCVAGTSRYDLFDDSSDGSDLRIWSDFTNVVDAIESEFGDVQALVECWFNSDSSFILSFKQNFWPFYFGRTYLNGVFTLGNTNPDGGSTSRPVNHCLWDGAAATNAKGRGIFKRDATQWRIHTPMPFCDGPVSPTAELSYFSEGDLRQSEPRRQTIIDLASDTLAQSVGIVVGPSAHITDFGGGIHPLEDDPDGQILLGWPLAISILRESGMTIGEPTITGISGATDGSYADIEVNLPNGGTLTTLREFRGDAMPGTPSPHQQEVTGFEISKASRKPVFNLSETGYASSHRGTVVIQDSGTGTPPSRIGKVRITPLEAFAYGNGISYLRGQATAMLQEPRDVTNKLFLDMLIEHVPSLYQAGATYPLEGIAVRPYQSDLTVNVPSPPFSPQSTSFDGSTSRIDSTTLTVAANNAFTLACWLYYDGTWHSPTANLLQLRTGTSVRMTVVTTNTGRLSIAIPGVTTFATPNNSFAGGAWHHVMISMNANAGGSSRYQVCVDGAAPLSGTADVSALNLTMNGETLTRFYFGSAAGSGLWPGDLAYCWVDIGNSIDLSVQANREKFILAGAPVDLGGDGSIPTGSAPEFFLDGGASMSNLGTGGALTAVALTLGAVPHL